MQKRALIVDDDPEFCALLEGFLGQLDYLPETAGNVAEARQRIDAAGTTNPFAVIVCDVNMPEVQGNELLKSLRNDGREIPIFVFATAQPDRATVTGLIGIEADYILCKPVSLDTLGSALEKAERRRTDREVEKVMKGMK